MNAAIPLTVLIEALECMNAAVQSVPYKEFKRLSNATIALQMQVDKILAAQQVGVAS